MNENQKVYIVYRGPLERTRLAFIFDLILDGKTDAKFIGIFPGRVTTESKAFILNYLHGYFPSVEMRQDKWFDFFSTVSLLRRLIGNRRGQRIVAIGFSSLMFLYPFRSARITWFVNGIPEEKSMNKRGIRRLTPALMWHISRILSPLPEKIVTVSSRMSDYVRRHFKNSDIIHAPTCADLATFQLRKVDKKGYLVYCGSGAKWQAIDLMKNVWDEIHRLDSSIKFRVISRDVRCRILGENISVDNIEFVQSNDHGKVAEYLQDCNLAFMLRRDDIVNRVCFPTKFAQYIASGCAVVTTSIDWDIRDYITDDFGMLVDPDAKPEEMAQRIVSFYRNLKTHPMAISAYAEKLDRKYWVEKVKEQLN